MSASNIKTEEKNAYEDLIFFTILHNLVNVVVILGMKNMVMNMQQLRQHVVCLSLQGTITLVGYAS